MSQETIVAIIGIVASGLIGFFSSKMGLKDEINNLKIEHEKLKARDNEQQIFIDKLRKEADELIPILVDKLNKKKKNGK
ncbi:hypothetical protein [Flavobacterium sp.]|uniref:hypothetical protein n=1 Tax=Flavobacterium sp. TaxID=239 RepID=UPI00260B82A4|nr:hypothetical protein [Flavobacterium sp.]